MSAIAAPTSVTSQVWQRLVRQGDSNGDNRLDKAELDALKAGSQSQADMDALVRAFDSDADQSLAAAELPSAPLSPGLLRPVLDWQAYAKADAATQAADDARAIDDLFARADVDGNGLLSKSEMDAERTTRRTRWLDGQASADDPAFIMRFRADPESLSREDIFVARGIPLSNVTPVPPDQIPAEVREAHQKMIAEYRKTDPVATPEERRQQMVTSVLSTPLDTAYVSRLLSQLSAAIARPQSIDERA